MFISVEFNAVAFVDECTITSSGEDASVCMNLSHPIQTYQNHFLIPVIIVSIVSSEIIPSESFCFVVLHYQVWSHTI
ncbi:hypothetical protein YC2023_019205 [Brassica napus]